MTCFVCRGSLEDKFTNYIADLGDSIIIIKNVPSQVCAQCGEVSYSDDVARRLEQIVNEMRKQHTEITVTQFVTHAA